MNVMEVFADCSENSASPAKVAATPPAAAGPALSPAADNTGGAGAEGDDDMAYARMVAEQERAFYMMRGGNAAELRGADGAMFESPEARGQAPMHDGAAAEEEDPDVAFARALMEEEARDWNARMLAMAGLPAPGDAAELEGMGVDEAYEEQGAVDVDGMTYEELLALGEAAGHVSRGCSAALVASLRRTQYSAAAHAAAGGAEQCAVCRLEYEVGDALAALPCAHHFHADCLAPWLRSNKTCPCCKREIEGASPAHAARRTPM